MTFRCPICKVPVESETHAEFPFCSERCRQHDLGNWAMEKYKVAAPNLDESESDERPQHESDSRTHSDDE